jgi:glutamate transport system permease protein
MSSALPVLYDVAGPRARRRALIGTVLASGLLIVVLAFVIRRLADQDQFSLERWGPLIDPSNDQFGQVWQRLGHGLGATVIAAALAITCSALAGTVIGTARMMLGRGGRVPLVALIELFRGLPVVLLIYFAYLALPDVGVHVGPLPGPDGLWYVVIGLTAYNSVIIAEILRAGVASLPRGQREAALACGLSELQTMRMILLPQALRTMLPALISQLVVILKDTSLAAIAGLYIELLREGLLIKEVLKNPLQTLFVVAVIFILVNFTLSRLAVLAERRLRRPGRTTRKSAWAGPPSTRHRPLVSDTEISP